MPLVVSGWSGNVLAGNPVSPQEINEGQTLTFTVKTGQPNGQFVLTRWQAGKNTASPKQYTMTPGGRVAGPFTTDGQGKFKFKLETRSDHVAEPSQEIAFRVMDDEKKVSQVGQIPDDDFDISIKLNNTPN